MQVLVTLNSGQGFNLGPNFTLSVPSGTIVPNTATITQLLAGKLVTVDSGINQITITSIGDCTNTLTLYISPTTTTTSTTTTSTTTSTTTTTTSTTTTTTTTASPTTTTTTTTIRTIWYRLNVCADGSTTTSRSYPQGTFGINALVRNVSTSTLFTIIDEVYVDPGGTQWEIVTTGQTGCPSTSTTMPPPPPPITFNMSYVCYGGDADVTIDTFAGGTGLGYEYGNTLFDNGAAAYYNTNWTAGTFKTYLAQTIPLSGQLYAVVRDSADTRTVKMVTPICATTTSTTSTSTSTTTQQTVWYNLTRCSNGSSAVSIGYILGTFVTNQLVVDGGGITYTILNYVTTNPGGTQLVITSVGGQLGCPTTTTTTTTAAPTTTTTTAAPSFTYVNVNYASSAFNACYAPTATFTMVGNASPFCSSTIFTSGGWGGVPTGSYFISYGGDSMPVNHNFGEGFATSTGGCTSCPVTTTTTTAAPTTTTTTTTAAPVGYTVNVYAKRTGVGSPICYIYRSTDNVNYVTNAVAVSTLGGLMYTLTIPSGTTLYLQQVNTSIASYTIATSSTSGYPSSTTGGVCTNSFTITSAINIYLLMSTTATCTP
jgi:Fe-S cluster biogenesis protein NfuA